MAEIIWSDHKEMKNRFKADVERYFGYGSIYIPNEIRITGSGISFQPDGLILSFNKILHIIFPEFKTQNGILDRRGTFFQLGKYNILKNQQLDAFISITDKLKKLDLIEYKKFIEKNIGSYILFYEVRNRLKFTFKTCLIKEGKDTSFINMINETMPHVIIRTYNCSKKYINA